MKAILWLLCIPAVALAQPAAVQTCAGCHGAHGEGNAQMNAPRLAGQPRAYLERQLAAYADGRREHQVMSPIAKGLAPEQRTEAAGHYAALQAPTPKRSAAAGSSSASAAARLATRGDDAREIQACQNCHGPGGVGANAINPYLAGLDAGYLEASLAEWKSGNRKTDPSGQMPRIAKNLRDADIKALAEYYANQAPPQPAATTQSRGGSDQPTQQGAGTGERQSTGVTGGDHSGSQGPGGAGTK